MSKKIAIRRLQSSDFESYRAIRLSALKGSPEAFGSEYEIEVVRPAEDFKERISSTIICAAFEGDDIVGMIGFRRHAGSKDKHKGYLWGSYVDPRARGRGVGLAIGSHLLKEVAGVIGLEQIILTVIEDNKAALSLYKRLGFTEYGVEPNALKKDGKYWNEILMILFLPKSDGK